MSTGEVYEVAVRYLDVVRVNPEDGTGVHTMMIEAVLTKQGDESVYNCTQEGFDRFECTCESWKYSRGSKRCKHTDALVSTGVFVRAPKERGRKVITGA